MKQVIQLIKSRPLPESNPLLNAIRYSTVHLGDESTPRAITQLLG